MPQIFTKAAQFKKTKNLHAEWDTFRKGLNLLLRPTELTREEYAQGDNIMLIGSGVPTGRWGTSEYFSVNATGSIKGFGVYENSASLTSEIIALSDQGYLAKKSGSSSSVITGQSYPSGSVVRAEQLGGSTFFVSKDRPLTRYNGSQLFVYATLSAPTGLTATNFSGATGSYTWSWKVVTLSTSGGQSTPSTAIELPSLPQDLTRTRVDIRWSAPSAVASMISGYEIYRGLPGDETLLANVGASTTTYVDTGEPASETILAPITNTTGGVKSPIIKKFKDRLLMVDNSDRTKLLISGRYPNHFKFSWADGGGSVYIDPDSGRDITGVDVQPGSDRIVVYKDFSHYAVSLDYVTIGNYQILDPQYQPISTSVGCSNPDTIQVVENDIFYFGRKGIYVTGYEPNFLSVIRTNEISARIRPYLSRLNENDYRNCCAMYVDNKYLLSFPDRKEVIVYDRERGCFAGIWKLPWGITKMIKYVDDSGTERWVIGVDSQNQTYTFERSVNSDNGTTISKALRTNKEAFSSWSELKIIQLFHILFRNVTGTVIANILLEDRNGITRTIKTFTITGSSVAGKLGWGANKNWGKYVWGKWAGSPVSGSDEVPSWGNLFKQGRLLQVEIICNQANSNFELLNVKFSANSQGEGSLSSSQRV